MMRALVHRINDSLPFVLSYPSKSNTIPSFPQILPGRHRRLPLRHTARPCLCLEDLWVRITSIRTVHLGGCFTVPEYRVGLLQKNTPHSHILERARSRGAVDVEGSLCFSTATVS